MIDGQRVSSNSSIIRDLTRIDLRIRLQQGGCDEYRACGSRAGRLASRTLAPLCHTFFSAWLHACGLIDLADTIMLPRIKDKCMGAQGRVFRVVRVAYGCTLRV